jgi:glycosyltransferase involved in cell wall biosynthesis
MRTANIAYIFTAIEFGGAERVTLTFLKNVDRARYRISLAALVRPWEQDSALLRELEQDGYPITRVPVARRPRSEGRDVFRLLSCFRAVHAFLKSGDFDLVHTHGYFADIMGIPAARLLGLPHVATCHGFIANDRKLRFYNRLDRLALRFSSRIIAVSSEIRRALIADGLGEERVCAIRNAVEFAAGNGPSTTARATGRAAFGLDARDFVIGFIGRLSREKGIHHLVEACGALKAAGVPLKLLIVGEGPQRQELALKAAREGLEREVVFAGFRNDVGNVLPVLDAFVLPSLTEGTPMALLEAMAAGLPVVASAVGGVPDVVEPNVNGLLVSPGSAEAIAQAVLRLHRDPLLRRMLSAEAAQTVRERYDVKDWTRRLEREYRRLIDKHPARRPARCSS